MDRLPIYEIESELIARLRETRRVIISAPTGSGKSTQIPQMLLRHGLLEGGGAVVLQPRRIAARLLAARVAHEMGVPLGAEVGYQVRFDSVVGPKTRIRYVTEGLLLRRMIDDPLLEGISALVFDEFHERHLDGDVTLARALDLQAKRPDLAVLVMSATLDIDLLAKYLAPCATVSSAGRTFPVGIRHRPVREDEPVWEAAAAAVAEWDGEGDALVFMPGAYEIGRTIGALRALPGRIVLPLHGELSPADQDSAVARHDRPKIVVATNVAETSLTIDGVRLVVDSGLARIPRYDPARGINTLLIEKISRASADQRAGRAGRTAPGLCVRLWPERETRAPRELPEVKRVDLAETALTLKAAGVDDLRKFRWLEPPPEAAVAHAEEVLADLGAADAKGAITPLGRRMVAFPVHPRTARMLLAAHELGCVREAALVAALTQGRDLLLRGAGSEAAEFREDRFGTRFASDFGIQMRAWEFAAKHDFRLDVCRRAGIHAQTARQVGPLRDRFLDISRREGLEVRKENAHEEALRKCILIGYPDRVARRIDQGTLRCDVVHGRKGNLARESVVHHSPLLVAAEIREVEGRNREVSTVLSLATAIEPEWLRELYPGGFSKRLHVEFDPGPKRVIAEERTCWRDLPLESRPIDPPPADAAAQLLTAEVQAGRLTLPEWNEAVEQWIARANFLAKACPELDIPPIDAEARRTIVEQVCQDAFSFKELKGRPVLPVVKDWLSPAHQALVEKHAPERVELSKAKRPKVTYAPEGPYVAVKIQDLFGFDAVPRIAMGKVAPLVHILAPNQRPVQITADLAGFWRDHYPRVKKELQRRYPKHEWR